MKRSRADNDGEAPAKRARAEWSWDNAVAAVDLARLCGDGHKTRNRHGTRTPDGKVPLRPRLLHVTPLRTGDVAELVAQQKQMMQRSEEMALRLQEPVTKMLKKEGDGQKHARIQQQLVEKMEGTRHSVRRIRESQDGIEKSIKKIEQSLENNKHNSYAVRIKQRDLQDLQIAMNRKMDSFTDDMQKMMDDLRKMFNRVDMEISKLRPPQV